MIYYIMQKNYFHNSKINIDFLETKTPIKKQYIRKKEKVDINTLLNKVNYIKNISFKSFIKL